MNTKQNDPNIAVESDIIRTLNAIGYPSSQTAWRDAAPMIDADGQTLRLLGHPVMERWEEPYMKKLAAIAAAKTSGLVTGGGGSVGTRIRVGNFGAVYSRTLPSTSRHHRNEQNNC